MHNIKAQKTLKLPLYNQGTNEMNIKFAKEMMIMNAVRSLTDTVSTKKHYPIDNVVEIDLSLDGILLTRKEYNQLIADSLGSQSGMQNIDLLTQKGTSSTKHNIHV